MSGPQYVLGIDPGFGGALALTNGYNASIKDMPINRYKGRKEVDAYALANLIIKAKADISFAVVENVGVMPNDGAVSMFRFGRGMGKILGVLAALDIKVVRIEPSVWKRLMGLSSDKSLSLKHAKKLYPQLTYLFKHKKDVDKAEALLMAHCGREALIAGGT